METNGKEEIIYVFHHNDLDGIAAAAMINLSYPNAEKHFIMTGYPVNFNRMQFEYLTAKENVTVFFVDLSFKNKGEISKLQNLSETVKQVVWIDHHEASQKCIDGLDQTKCEQLSHDIQFLVNMDACGAMLTYQYLHPDTSIPRFLTLVDVHDRHAGSEEALYMATSFNYAVMGISDLSPTSKIWSELLAADDSELTYVVERGKIIYDYLAEENKNFIKKAAVVTEICGIPCIAVNAQGTSILFDSVKDEFPLRVAWYFAQGEYKYTVYSDGTINCNAIANRFGGGGHPGAAGFKTQQLIFSPGKCTPYCHKS